MLKPAAPTRKAIDELVDFIAIFESLEGAFGDMTDTPDGRRVCCYCEDVEVFRRLVYVKGFVVVGYAWEENVEEARCYVSHPEKLDEADLDTVRRLITTHLRMDRFHWGHLMAMLESGHIVAILDRLKTLRDTASLTPAQETA